MLFICLCRQTAKCVCNKIVVLGRFLLLSKAVVWCRCLTKSLGLIACGKWVIRRRRLKSLWKLLEFDVQNIVGTMVLCDCDKATGEEPDQLYKTLEVEVKGHDTAVLNSYEKFVSMAAEHLGIKIGKMWVDFFLEFCFLNVRYYEVCYMLRSFCPSVSFVKSLVKIIKYVFILLPQFLVFCIKPDSPGRFLTGSPDIKCTDG